LRSKCPGILTLPLLPALLRRGDPSVTEVCFAVGCSSLGTFSSRFTELVAMPPITYRRHAARATEGMPSCVAKQVTRPIGNREAPVTAAPIMTVMGITVHASFLPHDDPDVSLAFYRDRPEVVPVVLLLLRAGPG